MRGKRQNATSGGGRVGYAKTIPTNHGTKRATGRMPAIAAALLVIRPQLPVVFAVAGASPILAYLVVRWGSPRLFRWVI
jgi:hypothetical protein